MDILYNAINTNLRVWYLPGKKKVPHNNNNNKTHAPCYEAVGRGNQDLVVARLRPNPDPSSEFEVLPTSNGNRRE